MKFVDLMTAAKTWEIHVSDEQALLTLSPKVSGGVYAQWVIRKSIVLSKATYLSRENGVETDAVEVEGSEVDKALEVILSRYRSELKPEDKDTVVIIGDFERIKIVPTSPVAEDPVVAEDPIDPKSIK